MTVSHDSTHHGMHHDHAIDLADAQEIEKEVDNAVAWDHPEYIEHAEPVSVKVWIAILGLAFIYITAQGMPILALAVINGITADLPPTTYSTWIASGFTIALGTAIITAGAISDLVGRRWFVIGGGILGILGGILGGTAHGVPQVITATTFLGLSQGAVSVAISGMAELTPKTLRGPVFGTMQFFSGIWVMAGSVFAHLLAERTAPGWRSVFWLALALNGGATVAVFFTYYPERALASFRTTPGDFIRRFDWIGLALVIVAPILMLMGIIWVQSHPATSAYFLAPFLIGCAHAAVLVYWEVSCAKEPLLQTFLFRQVRAFTLFNVCGLVGGMLFYSLATFLSTYLSVVFDGTDQIQIGVDSLPFGAGSITGAFIAGVTLPWAGKRVGTQWLLSLGSLLQLVFIALLAVADVNDKAMVLAFTFCAGLGIGAVEVLSILLTQLACPDEYIGFGYGLLGLGRAFGSSAGPSIYLTIFTSKSSTIVPTKVAAAAVGAGLPVSSVPQLLGTLTGVLTAPITDVPGISASIIEVSVLALKNAYIKSFQYVWYASIPFGVIALIAALFTVDLSSKITKKTAQHIKGDVHPESLEAAKVRQAIVEKHKDEHVEHVKT